jgi:hypothetical protein
LLDLYFTVIHDQENSTSEQKQSFLIEQFVKELVDGLPPY